MLVNFQLDNGAYKPHKAHNQDAGFDLYAMRDYTLEPGKVLKICTGVHLAIPSGFVGLVFGRSSSGLAGITTHTGVIDAGYTGAISVVIQSSKEGRILAGQRIGQIVIMPLPQVDLLPGNVTGMQTERGAKGFGSSGI